MLANCSLLRRTLTRFTLICTFAAIAALVIVPGISGDSTAWAKKLKFRDGAYHVLLQGVVSGKAKYSKKTNTLTLKNVKLKPHKYYTGITTTNASMTIKLVGKNTIKANKGAGIYGENIKICGSGSLTISGKSYQGIVCNSRRKTNKRGTFRLNSAKVKIKTPELGVHCADAKIKGGRLSIEGAAEAVSCVGNSWRLVDPYRKHIGCCTITGGKLGISKSKSGIKCQGGNLTVKKGDVDISSCKGFAIACSELTYTSGSSKKHFGGVCTVRKGAKISVTGSKKNALEAEGFTMSGGIMTVKSCGKKAGYNAIECGNGPFVMTGGKLTVTKTGKDGNGINAGKMTMSGGTIAANGNGFNGIGAEKSLSISGGSITCRSNGGFGIEAPGKKFKVTGGTVTVGDNDMGDFESDPKVGKGGRIIYE